MAEEKTSRKAVSSVFKRAVRNIRKNPKKDFIVLGLPEAKRTQAIEKAIKKKWNREPKLIRGIVYLSHIPPGFYEKQIFRYFSQFGSVTRVKVARSEKTGKSRGHAYVEFKFVEVAKIVAETMNNYLMCNRLVKAELIEKRFPSSFWRRIDPKNCPGKGRSKAHVKFLNKRVFNITQIREVIEQKKSKLQETCQKLKMAGIDFSFEPECADIDTKISGEGKYKVLDKNESPIENEDLVLELDESDDEIEFNPPPNVIIRKLVSSHSGDSSLKKKTKLSEKSMKRKRGKVAKESKETAVVGLKKKLPEVAPSNILRKNKNKNRYFDVSLSSETATLKKDPKSKKGKKLLSMTKCKKAAKTGAK